MNSVIPNFEWYKAQNPLQASPYRCPFGAAECCPKYADSVGVLVRNQIWDTYSEPESIETSIQPKQLALEDGPHMMSYGGKNDWRHDYRNFCPEVLAKEFGLFVSHLSSYYTEDGHQDSHRALKQQGVDESHPNYKWRDYTPQHYTDCDRYSILYGQRTQIPAPKYDMRGAQIAGGVAETVEGNQAGGQIKN